MSPLPLAADSPSYIWQLPHLLLSLFFPGGERLLTSRVTLSFTFLVCKNWAKTVPIYMVVVKIK